MIYKYSAKNQHFIATVSVDMRLIMHYIQKSHIRVYLCIKFHIRRMLWLKNYRFSNVIFAVIL